MTPIKTGRYEYRPSSLIQLRQKLKLKQKEMAKLLEIPPNTLSRWENGASTPDAESLAAIYSIAMEKKVKPEFFHRTQATAKQTKGRSRLIVLWDFQYVAVSSQQLDEIVDWVDGQLNKRFGRASYRLFKAFAWGHQSSTTDELAEKGWRVFEDNQDLIGDIHVQAKSDCGHDPEDTTVVLIALHEEYAGLVAELKKQNVRVYLITPPNNYDESLVNVVGRRRWIPLPNNYSTPLGTQARNLVRQFFS